MSLKKPLLFIRGLNSKGIDQLHFGPFNTPFRMQKRWEDFFKSQGVAVFSVRGLVGGSLLEQKECALRYLEQHTEELRNGFHILGHSAGGLVGWGIASEDSWKDKALSLTTLATPHQGSLIGGIYEEFLKKPGKLFFTSQERKDHLIRLCQGFSREQVLKFKDQHKIPSELPLASFSFALPEPEMSWPIRIPIGWGLGLKNLEYDGFVETSSMIAGKHLGQFELDHLSQLDYHFYLSPFLRAKKRKLFYEVGFRLMEHLRGIETRCQALFTAA